LRRYKGLAQHHTDARKAVKRQRPFVTEPVWGSDRLTPSSVPYETEATVGGLPGHWLEQTEGRKKPNGPKNSKRL
jgi:hypothetical protein